MNKVKRSHIFRILQEQTPEPTTELVYSSTFELLVAVILSAQSTDAGVNKATPALFKAANTPSAMLKLGLDRLKEYIKTIGLYNTKAANIIEACEILVKEHGGRVPRDRESLEKLPGVGRKTASVILNTAFGEPAIPVDTHIFRVSNRTKIAPGKSVLEVEKGLLKLVPDEYKQNAHHWLLLHGRYTCTARQPKCYRCVIYDHCEWKQRKLFKEEPGGR